MGALVRARDNGAGWAGGGDGLRIPVQGGAGRSRRGGLRRNGGRPAVGQGDDQQIPHRWEKEAPPEIPGFIMPLHAGDVPEGKGGGELDGDGKEQSEQQSKDFQGRFSFLWYRGSVRPVGAGEAALAAAGAFEGSRFHACDLLLCHCRLVEGFVYYSTGCRRNATGNERGQPLAGLTCCFMLFSSLFG